MVQNHKDGTIWIGQPTFTESVLKKSEMDNCKSLTTPVDTRIKLVNGSEDSEYVDENRLWVACFISIRTQPDITYAVSAAARFCSNPTIQHLTAVKHILRY